MNNENKGEGGVHNGQNITIKCFYYCNHPFLYFHYS